LGTAVLVSAELEIPASETTIPIRQKARLNSRVEELGGENDNSPSEYHGATALEERGI
jgi:hypothetical protein